MNKIGTLQGKRSLVSEAVQGHAVDFLPQPIELLSRSPLSSTSLGGSLLSSAAGGAASGLVGNLLGEIESLFRRDIADGHDEELYAKRDTSSISNIIKQAQTLSASDKATVKTALMNKIGTLQGKRDVASTSTGTGTGTGAPFPFPNPLLTTPQVTQPATSLTPEEIASLSSLFFRSVVSTPEVRLSARSPLSSTSLSGSLLSSAAGGAASGLVGNLLGEIESFFRRDATEGHAELHAKRLSFGDAAGKALGGLANVGAKNAVDGLLTDIENLFRRGEPELETRAPLSATSLSGSLLSSAAGGAASGLVGNLLGEIESLFRRSEQLEIDELD
ncbi:hypothetical protein DL93DRAFT_969505 [Clavulina sp. PMI_390]|nr:hypothetical protein DL93DRAFT_969505 [Clavulina sp. PMI_390]